MNQPLEWHTEQRRVNDLLPLDINPRKISEARRMKMIESLQRFNLVDIPVVDFDGTIISGHQLHRRCYGIEIDPKYCQVIVDRMLRLDPTLEVKRNGHPYQPKKP